MQVALGVALAAALAGTAAEMIAPQPAGAQVQLRGPQSLAPLAERLIDAVVNISTTTTVKGPSGAPLPKVPKGAPFEEFFEDYFSTGRGGQRSRQDRKVSSLGSGFVIDGREGLIVTNVHVIDGADEIVANFADGSKLKIDKVLGRDPKTDLALLKVTPKKALSSVRFGNSEAIKPGDWVMAIGNPFGLGGSVTVGIISAKARDINSGPYDDYLQTDAAINKGNSGGPLFDMDGNVVGVNTAIISPTGGSIGIGFAVPAEVASYVIDQLKQYGETRRGWLGVNVSSVTEDIAEQLGVKENVGAHVASVTNNSPAASAGIEAGDIILRFDGKEISSMRGLPRVVAQTPVGKTVDVEYLRKGQKRSTKVVVARLTEDQPAGGSLSGGAPAEAKLVGLKLVPLTDELKRKHGFRDSVTGLLVTEVDPNSVAAQRDVKVGDVIVEAQDEAVSTIKDIEDKIDKVRKSGRSQILLRIENAKGEMRSVALPFG